MFAGENIVTVVHERIRFNDDDGGEIHHECDTFSPLDRLVTFIPPKTFSQPEVWGHMKLQPIDWVDELLFALERHWGSVASERRELLVGSTRKFKIYRDGTIFRRLEPPIHDK